MFAVNKNKPILGKIQITGTVHCLTGLHIGKAQDDWQIGGLDSPVVRDPMTYEPYIPGSSFRGKLRAIFERVENGKDPEKFQFNRYSGQEVYRHECTDPSCKVCRLFGATKGTEKEKQNIPSRLMVRDLRLKNRDELETIDTGLQYTELKFENALDRVTAAANPRQIERVPAGAQFGLDMTYTVETEDQEQTTEDLQNLLMLLKLVQDDAIGGHGARGYGKIEITDLTLEARQLAYYQATVEKAEEKKHFVKLLPISLKEKIEVEALKSLIQFIHGENP